MTTRTLKTSLVARSGLCALRQIAALLLGLVMLPSLQAQTFTTLYNFTGGSDGGFPYAGVIRDAAGNLYGTAIGGGSYDDGVLYEIDTVGTETVLYSFSQDGKYPYTPLAGDNPSSAYATTSGDGSAGNGALFKLDAAGNATVLYRFSGGSDGCFPYQGPIVGKSGVVFGTTSYCGVYNYGTIFKLDSVGNFTLLHRFNGSDGASPENGHLATDDSGNLYGVTPFGGTSGVGVLYRLSENGTFTILHSFRGGTTDGSYPYGSVVLDESGNLYGTTYFGGSDGDGTIWKMSKTGKEIVLHSFAGSPSDGCTPTAGVARDSKGNLYGVASCGAYNHGALYELGATGSLTLLHSFNGSDGDSPLGEVVWTPKGMLFGTTRQGGSGSDCTSGCGTVWSYAP